MERRAAIQMRAAPGRRLEGLAAPFNQEARIGAFREIIPPGAFAGSLAAGAMCWPWSTTTRAGCSAAPPPTLRLRETTRGLEFDLDLEDHARRRYPRPGRARRPRRGQHRLPGRAGAWPARDRRELRAVKLMEISIVHAHPAYAETEVSVRSRPSRSDERRLRLKVAAL